MNKALSLIFSAENKMTVQVETLETLAAKVSIPQHLIVRAEKQCCISPWALFLAPP